MKQLQQSLLLSIIAIVFRTIFAAELAADASPPNIVWITAEDMSPTLGCYGNEAAHTPHIDLLASQSVRYTHAFATAPVCSPVRSTLMTGCYATSLGTHNMRSAMPLPSGVRGFPAWLREAGYYTTNNVKTDYNTSDAARLVAESWEECSAAAHWRNRPEPRRPFFSVFNLMTSHQSRSMVWPRDKFVTEVQSRLRPEDIRDPKTVPLPPYYPDTPVVRREWARYYDCVTAMDQEVGKLLQQLRDDNLLENTIVFFFSDHGSGMPRHKRALLDTGMHVPLLIRFPAKYRHLAPAAPGTTTDRLVSFVDFPPTVLKLAGVAVPTYMQGQPFLNPAKTPAREYVFGHRDRVDEAFDCARSVRSRRYLYIRNYMPRLGYNQPTAWPDQGEIRHEFYRLAESKTLTPAQRHFMAPTRPDEEFYDCLTDPLNLNNLAGQSRFASELDNLRQVLDSHLNSTNDLGFIPEAVLAEAKSGRFSTGFSNIEETAAHYRRMATRRASLEAESTDDAQRGYWDLMRFVSSSSDPVMELAEHLKPDWSSTAEIITAIAAAGLVVQYAANDPEAIGLLEKACRADDLNVVLPAMRTIELAGKAAAAAVPVVRQTADRCQAILPAATTATFVQSPEQDLAMFISFSANAFLNRHAAGR